MQTVISVEVGGAAIRSLEVAEGIVSLLQERGWMGSRGLSLGALLPQQFRSLAHRICRPRLRVDLLWLLK